MIKAVPINAIYADMWRYIVLYKYGGIYLDIDMEFLKPIQEWPGYPWENVSAVLCPEPLYN